MAAVARYLAATCGVIEFELSWATRSGKEFEDLRADRDTGYEWLPTLDQDWRRALDVQAALWRGQVRAVGRRCGSCPGEPSPDPVLGHSTGGRGAHLDFQGGAT
jgi:hypothetical protein